MGNVFRECYRLLLFAGFILQRLAVLAIRKHRATLFFVHARHKIHNAADHNSNRCARLGRSCRIHPLILLHPLDFPVIEVAEAYFEKHVGQLALNGYGTLTVDLIWKWTHGACGLLGRLRHLSPPPRQNAT